MSIINISTTIQTNVKNSKVYAVSFSAIPLVNVIESVRAFVLPKLVNGSILAAFTSDGSIAELTHQTTGSVTHQGTRTNEVFVGQLYKEFTDLATPTNAVAPISVASGAVHYVFIVTVDGINQMSVRVARILTD